VDHVENHFRAFGIELRHRFVHHEQVRVLRDGGGDRQSLFLTTGEVSRILIAIAGQTELLQHVLDVPSDPLLVHEVLTAERDVLLHGETDDLRLRIFEDGVHLLCEFDLRDVRRSRSVEFDLAVHLALAVEVRDNAGQTRRESRLATSRQIRTHSPVSIVRSSESITWSSS
jgi:hypothetical protein